MVFPTHSLARAMPIAGKGDGNEQEADNHKKLNVILTLK